MAKASSTAATFTELSDLLGAQKTVTELFKLANDDSFKRAARSLNPDELTELRKQYKAAQSALDGKVRLEEFDGQILNIIDIDYWQSDQFVDESKGQTGEGVTLKYRPENEIGKVYKSLTSSSVLVRFAKQFETPPTEANPVRVMVHLEPVRDVDRARLGQRVWKIKRLPNRGEENTGSPF